MAAITRKELARLLDCSVDQIRNNEVRWGIRRWRIPFNSRFIRYRKAQTIESLIRFGVIAERET